MILTHYYHRNEQPFQTLSSLSEDDAIRIMANLSERHGAVYSRFRDPKKYWQKRLKTESWLRKEFIKKGGITISPHPIYFVVERATWIEEGFNGESNMIQIPLTNFDSKQISFTYSDSMVSYWLKSQTHQEFLCSKYHGQVFTLSEICQITDEFGIPEEEWRTDASRKHDLFIEAQIWGNIPV